MAPYMAAAVQFEVEAAYADRDAIWRNLRHAGELLDEIVSSVQMTTRGRGPKLVVFPESFLHGFGSLPVRSHEESIRMASHIPGPETDLLSEMARKHELYLAGSMFELDDGYPGHFFNTGFIIDPNGDVILRYRKITTTPSIEASSNPGDVLGKYGMDPKELFPVVDTEIGRLGMTICYDRRFPEPSRCVALNGAEILIHPTGGGGGLAGSQSSIEWWRRLSQVRAFENNFYLIGAQWAHSPKSELITGNGHSLIVDFNGNILTELDGVQEGFVVSTIDPELVRARRQPGASFLMELPTPIYAEAYSQAKSLPIDPDGYREIMPKDLLEKHREAWEVYERLCEEGVLRKPEGSETPAAFRRS